MKERSDGGSVILFRVRVIVVMNEVRCLPRFFRHWIYRGTPASSFHEERDNERERERGRESVRGGVFRGRKLLVFVPSPTFAKQYTPDAL